MTLIELNNCCNGNCKEQFDKYKNNNKLLMVITENGEQYNKISNTIKALSEHNENILFLIINKDICGELQVAKTCNNPISFICSINGTEVKRCEATDSKSLEDLIKFLNNHTMI